MQPYEYSQRIEAKILKQITKEILTEIPARPSLPDSHLGAGFPLQRIYPIILQELRIIWRASPNDS